MVDNSILLLCFLIRYLTAKRSFADSAESNTKKYYNYAVKEKRSIMEKKEKTKE